MSTIAAEALREHLLNDHNGHSSIADEAELHWTHSMEHLDKEGKLSA